MCWSAPVSLAFAVADLVGIAALLWRRQPWWALAAAPIAAQEALQFVLWRELAADASACSDVNSGATLAVQLVLGLDPITWVSLSVFGPPARRPVPLGEALTGSPALRYSLPREKRSNVLSLRRID